MRRTLLLALVAVGCSSVSHIDPPAGAGGSDAAPPAESPPPVSSLDAGSLPPPPPPSIRDAGVDARPPPGPTVRSCGSNETSPTPLGRYVLHPTTSAIFLGEGIGAGGPNGIPYAQENPYRLDTSGTSMGSVGPDMSAEEVAGTFGWSVDGILLPAPDLFKDRADGMNPVQAWSKNVGASELRLTYVQAWSFAESVWQPNPEQRASTAPADDQAEYVRFFHAQRYAAFALLVDVPSTCTMGALADALHRSASIGNPDFSGKVDYPVGGLLDPEGRAAAQAVLVRDGAKLALTVVSNGAWPDAERIVSSSACAADNLAACADAMVGLRAASDAFVGAAKGPSDYASIKTGNDPLFQVTTYKTGKVVWLGP